MSTTFKQKLIFFFYQFNTVYVAPPSIVHPVDFRDRKYYKKHDRVSLQFTILQFNVLVGKMPNIKPFIILCIVYMLMHNVFKINLTCTVIEIL